MNSKDEKSEVNKEVVEENTQVPPPAEAVEASGSPLSRDVPETDAKSKEVPSEEERKVRITLSALNAIISAFQGKQVWLGCFLKWKVAGYAIEQLDSCNNLIQEYGMIVSEVIKGKTLFDKRALESGQQERVKDLLLELHTENLRIADSLDKIIGAGFPPTLDSARYLLATFARYSYSKDHFVRGIFFMEGLFGNYEKGVAYAGFLTDSDLNAKLTMDLDRELTEKGELSESALRRLWDATEFLADSYRLLACDLVILKGEVAGKKVTYNEVGILKEEVESWSSANILAETAAYWNAVKFSAEETRTWLNAGVLSVYWAATWKRLGFNHEEAQAWNALGLSPYGAREWKKAGHSSEKAAELLAKGIIDPTVVPGDE